MDPPGEEGLAHLVEHLTYRAVDPVASGGVALTRWNRLIQAAVGEMNGYTTPDCLIFYEIAAPAELSTLVGLETARLADPLAAVDERAFALERDIIGSEDPAASGSARGGVASPADVPSSVPARAPLCASGGGAPTRVGRG